MKETENGWIKLNKKILKWGWYSDVNVKITFLHLLLVANYEEGEYLGQKIKRGQAVIGLGVTSKKIGISIQNLRTALEKLEKSGEITRKSTNKFTLVTIENYNKYQGSEMASNNSTNKRLTNKEYKNNKNIRNIYISDIVASEPAELHDHLDDFVKMRKSIKAPLTARALKSVLKELEKLSGGDIKTKIAILEQSIVKCWKTVYPLKNEQTKQSEYKEDPYSINF